MAETNAASYKNISKLSEYKKADRNLDESNMPNQILRDGMFAHFRRFVVGTQPASKEKCPDVLNEPYQDVYIMWKTPEDFLPANPSAPTSVGGTPIGWKGPS